MKIVLLAAIAIIGLLFDENYRLKKELKTAKTELERIESGKPEEELDSFGIPKKIYDKNIPPETDCSEIEDGLCPQWCMPGADYDCCIRAGDNEWIPGRGCYPK